MIYITIQINENGAVYTVPEELILKLLGPNLSGKLGRFSPLKQAVYSLENILHTNAHERRAQKILADQIFGREAKPRPDPACLDIAFIVPKPDRGSGGNRNIYRAIQQLKNRGHNLTVYCHHPYLHPAIVKKRVQDWYYPLEGVNFLQYRGLLAHHDLCFATSWETAYALQDNRDKIGRHFYFVQDFEPMFMPVSSDYILADATYTLGFNHICSGPWCADILRNRHQAKVDFFQFPVDTDIYNQRETRTKTERNLIFFAKPEMERRCFSLGMRALHIFHQLRPEVEIILFGSDELRRRPLPFPCTKLGLLGSLEGLARLYRNADLGLIFSPTNPSLVPFEMLACGCPVADLNFDRALSKYGGQEDNIFLLPLHPEAMARRLAEIFDQPGEMRRRADSGRKYVETAFPTEEGMGQRLEELILQGIQP